jgi:sugar/nucleoside kinase (ribokinase family)
LNSILIIGCVSLDTIHLEQNGSRQSYNTIGGAGLFTALAAAHSGAEVTLYAPKASPMPAALAAVDKAVNWIGPLVKPDEMPTLEIVHHGEGRATLITASWGPEKLLVPESLYTTTELSHQRMDAYDTVHIAALSTAKRQFEFLKFFSEREAPMLISVGTYARAINADRETVRRLLDQCNAFFMNSNEAALLFDGGAIVPKNSQLIFVTDGKNGATVYEPSVKANPTADTEAEITKTPATHIEATLADELDPTGAGDTFCGAALAGLSKQLDAISAARLGTELAAKIIEHPGSSFYF